MAWARDVCCGHRSMLDLHPSGFYAWRAAAESKRGQEDRRLSGHIKQSWLESGAVYGYRKIHTDLRELGETCGRNRVYRLMKRESLRAQVGYRRRPGLHGGLPAVIAPNRLEQQFGVEEPNRAWVTVSPTSGPMRAGTMIKTRRLLSDPSATIATMGSRHIGAARASRSDPCRATRRMLRTGGQALEGSIWSV